MVSYTTRMPSGFIGQVTRDDSKTIVSEIIDATTPPTAYGSFVKLVSGKLQPIASGDAASVVLGLLVQPFPVQASGVVSALDTAATPPASGLADVMRRGYLAVKLAQGTAAKKGQVYVRVTADTGKAVGDIETAADSAKCVAVTGCFFTGAADANGVVEVEFNI